MIRYLLPLVILTAYPSCHESSHLSAVIPSNQSKKAQENSEEHHPHSSALESEEKISDESEKIPGYLTNPATIEALTTDEGIRLRSGPNLVVGDSNHESIVISELSFEDFFALPTSEGITVKDLSRYDISKDGSLDVLLPKLLIDQMIFIQIRNEEDESKLTVQTPQDQIHTAFYSFAIKAFQPLISETVAAEITFLSSNSVTSFEKTLTHTIAEPQTSGQFFGGAGNDVSVGLVVNETSGDILLTGSYSGTVSYQNQTYNSSTTNGMILRLGKDRQVIWSKEVASSGTDVVRGAVFTNDGGIIVTGTTTGVHEVAPMNTTSPRPEVDGFVFGFDANGNQTWGHQFVSEGRVFITSITKAGDADDVILGIDFRGNLSFSDQSFINRGDKDILLVRLSKTDGRIIWSRHIGGSGGNEVNNMTLASDGFIYVLGSTRQKLIDNTDTTDSSTNTNHIFIFKLNPATSDFQIISQIPVTGLVWGTRIAVSPTGEFAICGVFEKEIQLGNSVFSVARGERDFFTIFFGSDSLLKWVRVYGSAESDWYNDLVFDRSGNLLLSASFVGDIIFDQSTLQSMPDDKDIALVSLSPENKLLWTKQINNPGYDNSGLGVAGHQSLVTLTDNSLLVLGEFRGPSFNFDGVSATNKGNADTFLLQIPL